MNDKEKLMTEIKNEFDMYQQKATITKGIYLDMFDSIFIEVPDGVSVHYKDETIWITTGTFDTIDSFSQKLKEIDTYISENFGAYLLYPTVKHNGTDVSVEYTTHVHRKNYVFAVHIQMWITEKLAITLSNKVYNKE